MQSNDLFQELKNKFRIIVQEKALLDEQVVVKGKTLAVEDAIGKPKRQDFPLIKGKEKLMQATFKGVCGQAYSDMSGSFSGSLAEIIDKPLETHFDMAVFIATLNAVLRYLGLAEKTIHCKDEEPEFCAEKLIAFIRENYGNPKIALIGFQPSFLERLALHFSVRVLDMDKDRIDTIKFGVRIEDGEKDMADVLDWCDLIFATGSTVANGTITNFTNRDKPIIFYGTTIAGAASLLGFERYCECAK
ncbi:Rossmann-like domain-containing protein [Acetobacterium woodii]|uniref:Putative heavy-metal chelation domain-containing protein n=1 Tax=Acetobacterium woodii (strain ATCC 29683 / DSM 1030 / JCM 2381 / KCTC 1655 / WB1) TaxID=931626 RepID=H6LIB2_ACEWD|nr:DUF364 domain-containing protein [Acetobacterium woodii]AFA47286.1 hypothetical protein Awo_c04870 [Acetobacterium woodii DSM 1030]